MVVTHNDRRTRTGAGNDDIAPPQPGRISLDTGRRLNEPRWLLFRDGSKNGDRNWHCRTEDG